MRTMKVKTTEPLTMAEIVALTGKDAIHTIAGYRCRIMNVSSGQIIDVNRVVYVSDENINWGLREIKSKSYQYLAYKCEVVE